MRAWLEGLSASDRRMVTLGGAFVALVLLWIGVWEPLANSRATLRAEAAANAEALAWMRPAAGRLIARGGVDSPSVTDTRSLLARVDAGAREAGLAASLGGVEPQGNDRVRVSLAAADFDVLASWLEALAAGGVSVEEFSAQRATAGRVDARLLLREGAR